MSDAAPNGYAGQAGENTGTSDYNAMCFVVSQLMAQMATMIPVKVTKITNTGGLSPVGLIDVQPLISQINGLGQPSEHGVILDVPYFRLQGGKNAVILDPVVDDIGMMIVSMRDMSAVKSTKKLSNPGSYRQYDFADGVYVGGILNGTPEQYVQFNSAGVTIADKNGNKVEMKAGGNFFTGLIVAQSGIQISGDIHNVGGGTYSGNIVTTGNIQGANVATPTVTLNGHIHAANNTPPTPGH